LAARRGPYAQRALHRVDAPGEVGDGVDEVINFGGVSHDSTLFPFHKEKGKQAGKSQKTTGHGYFGTVVEDRSERKNALDIRKNARDAIRIPLRRA